MAAPQIGAMLRKWEHDGVRRRPPVDQEAIATFEQLQGVVLPLDFAEYLLTVDGMGDEDIDSDMFCFWQLSRIQSLPDLLPEPHYETYRNFGGAESFFCFADWSILGELFFIRLSQNLTTEATFISLGPRSLSCRTFTEFIESYLKNFTSLL
jgi:hypothetical protein